MRLEPPAAAPSSVIVRLEKRGREKKVEGREGGDARVGLEQHGGVGGAGGECCGC